MSTAVRMTTIAAAVAVAAGAGYWFAQLQHGAVPAAQQQPVDMDALRTEVAGTVIAEIYSTVSAEFAVAATSAAAT